MGLATPVGLRLEDEDEDEDEVERSRREWWRVRDCGAVAG
jgi:hypothetical protein